MKFKDRKQDNRNNPFRLPDWLFITGKAQDTEFIKNRTILIHKPSYSVLEVFANKAIENTYKGPSYEFRYTNDRGIVQKYLLYMYCTLTNDIYLIFRMATEWYCNYLEWKEANEERIKQN